MRIILFIILSISVFSESIVCSNHAIKSIVQEIIGRNHEIITIAQPDESPVGYHVDADEIAKSAAGQSLIKLNRYQKPRLMAMVRNAHALAKYNRPIKDFVWLCELDRAKGTDVGDTYVNQQKGREFIGRTLFLRSFISLASQS